MISLQKHVFFMLMALLWWEFWLSLSVFEISGLNKPGIMTIIQVQLLLIFTFLGGSVAFYIYKRNSQYSSCYYSPPKDVKFKNLILYFTSFALLFSLWKANFFGMSYFEYHMMVRNFDFSETLTGSKFLDLFSKIVIYPILVTLFLINSSLAESKINKSLLYFSIISYAVLWQVNYPFIFIFLVYFINIFFLVKNNKAKEIVLLVVVGVILLIAATIRFGGVGFSYDLIEHYLINYHIIGFSFYDAQFSNPNSILFEHTFGRSSLGVIDQFFDLFTRFMGGDFTAASFENRDFNQVPIDLGGGIKGNAFGTMLFTFYRDFSYVGIILGGFIYGFFMVYFHSYSSLNWRYRAIFILLSYGWFTGMMVSPIEQGYFWFSILYILLISRFSWIKCYKSEPG
ncbi:O-antigen polymerase [Shewanella algae]|uniref:O-antigen polymerase n=1 Tax=Shewanella algae TaxID=38313 RepID=UPI0031F5BAE4